MDYIEKKEFHALLNPKNNFLKQLAKGVKMAK